MLATAAAAVAAQINYKTDNQRINDVAYAIDGCLLSGCRLERKSRGQTHERSYKGRREEEEQRCRRTKGKGIGKKR